MAGCATLGNPLDRTAAPPENAPSAAEILVDLAANDEAITTFRAAADFTLESPELKRIRKFRRGSIKFRRPADLYIQAKHYVMPTTLLKLTCVGSEFLMEFPKSQENSFYQLDGEEFEDVPFSVSPSDIVREMFLPERWRELKRNDVRVIAYDETTGVATLAVGDRRNPRRLVEVAPMNADAPAWVIVRNTRLDDAGQVLAVTTSSDYHMVDGVRFPATVESYFPTEETRMTLSMRGFRVNVDLSDEEFDIRGRARELGLLPPESTGGTGR